MVPELGPKSFGAVKKRAPVPSTTIFDSQEEQTTVSLKKYIKYAIKCFSNLHTLFGVYFL